MDKVEDVFLFERARRRQEERVFGNGASIGEEGRRGTMGTRLWLMRVENLVDQRLLFGGDGD
jgi:hypothetical protein